MRTRFVYALAATLLLPVLWSVSPARAAEAVPEASVPERAADNPSALVLAEGAVARRQLVAVGRNLRIEGEAMADVAALDGDAWITGSVDGDVIVLGGNVHLAATARVTGDVFALGGMVDAAAGCVVDGRMVSHPTISAAWLTLLEGPTVGLSAFDPLVVGAKLALVTAWLAVTLLFFAVSGREVLATSESVTLEPFRNFFLGLTASLTLLLFALFFSAFAAALVGIPMLALVVVAALVLKLWGMVAVFHAAGRWCLGLLGRRFLTPAPLNAAVAGLLVLGAFKLVPWVGAWVWTAATLIGIGATLETKFGRREPWFATAEEASGLAPDGSW
ncbi:MAG TPA: polymer-forming cytoskeletal protein [Thermoanaerobaculia bacterium]|nr:polymer-forming cytoskeletal protein [Thermoanaerobaculia bacterium]